MTPFKVFCAAVVVAALPAFTFFQASGAAAAADSVVQWGDLDTSSLELYPTVPEPTTPVVFLLGYALGADRQDFARSVSDPHSSSYGRYETVGDVVTRFGASEPAAAAVGEYFASVGLTADLDPTRVYSQVVMTLGQAEAVFDTTWRGFVYPDSSDWGGLVMLYPTSTPQLPAELDGVVDRVHGAVAYSLTLAEESFASSDAAPPAGESAASVVSPVADGGTAGATGTKAGCAEGTSIEDSGLPVGLTPNQVKTAYGIDALHGLGLRGQGMRVAIVDDTVYEPQDLETFRACFGLESSTPVTDHVVGTPYTVAEGEELETLLDLSVMSFVAPELESLDVYLVGPTAATAAADPVGMLALFDMVSAPIDAALGGAPAPDVISASFGTCEAAPMYWRGQSAGISIFDDVLATGAAAGISYVVSTGDSGSSSCQANLGESFDALFPEETVQYPSSSAWVTAVGGTNLTLAEDNSIISSGVWNDTTFLPLADLASTPSLRAGGTGGTSTLVERPWFQDTSMVPAGTQRVVPDVSLFGDLYPGYAMFVGAWENVGGTSAATPLFAGMIALLDQHAVASRQPRLGFVSPLLYEMGANGSTALLDVTAGTNNVFPEAQYGVTCCDATVGFDLASGWGSPKAVEMLTQLAPPTGALSATQQSPGSKLVDLEIAVAVAGGSAQRFQWDIDGDATIDATTDVPFLTVDYSTIALPGVGTDSVRVSPSVIVTTTYGRRGVESTTLALVPLAQLSFVG